jgi:hypothetical protein
VEIADQASVEEHPFEPRDEWWSLCRICGLAESAHFETTVGPNQSAPDVHEDE